MSLTNCSLWKTSSRQFKNIFLSVDVRAPNWTYAIALTWMKCECHVRLLAFKDIYKDPVALNGDGFFLALCIF